MNKRYKNYLDDIKNKKFQDKFIEHIIRILFFTVVLSVEAVYGKSKEIIFHLKNILKRRTLYDMLKKYNRYKDSVNSMLHNHSPIHNLHDRIHETMNRLFNDDEKKLIFGFKDTTHNFLEKSKHIFTSVSDYTKSVKSRYFKYKSPGEMYKNYSTSTLTLFILKKYQTHKSSLSQTIDTAVKKEYAEILSSGYHKFLNETFSKFYSNDFKKKLEVSSIDIKSLKPHIKKIFDTIEKLERKKIRYTLGQS